MLLAWLLPAVALFGQQALPDSVLEKSFPVHIGNLAFGTDSLEIVVGQVPRGEVYQYQLSLYNLGKKPIELKSGKSNRFVDIRYEPELIQPGQTATAFIDFDVIADLPLGPISVELVFETDDKQNAFKFLYLLADIVDDEGLEAGEQLIIDTVPRMIFNDYNFDFGFLNRGKRVIHTFYYTNMGAKDLVVEKVTCSSGCSVLTPPDEITPPGASGILVVEIRTTGNIGVQHRTVKIKTNDPVTPVIILGLHGTVRTPPPSKQNQGFCYE